MATRKSTAKKTTAKKTTAKKTTAKKTTAKKTTAKKTPSNYRVRIRMYRQGLGDCFLLSFPDGAKKYRHMLIDCGVVLGTSEPSVVMKQVAQNIMDETDGKLDVLVVTHEHWDHLSGFDPGQAREVFGQLKIGELWLAWTESDTNPLAIDLRWEMEKKREAARLAKKKLEKLGEKGRKQALRMSEILGLFGAKAADSGDGDDGLTGTAGTLEYLKSLCAPTILDAGTITKIPGVKDTRVFVLGPPQDSKRLRQTNPHKGEGYGLGSNTLSLSDSFVAAFDPKDLRYEMAQPFPLQVRHTVTPNAASNPIVWQEYLNPENEWRKIDHDWLGTGERLALQLDNATNNTSLVLAIELGGQDVLLFVGDAQAGNWRSWESVEWKSGKESDKSITAADLLGRTIFYKVGHHGSHNATMGTKGLELMTNRRLAAVIPVDTKVAHQVKGWRHMPLPKIRERLGQKCSVVFQSDLNPDVRREQDAFPWIDSTETFNVMRKDKDSKKTKSVGTRSLYTDYFV